MHITYGTMDTLPNFSNYTEQVVVQGRTQTSNDT